jgi:L-ascorbate metabolism protein UlaG (beta-lactamase superfamily)
MTRSGDDISFDINLRSQARFSNRDPLAEPRLSRVLKWAVVDRVAGRRRQSPKTAVIPSVSAPIPPRSADSVLWLGHATAMITLAGVRILTDPVLWGQVGPGVRRNVPSPWSEADIPDVDVVVLSHNHRDHLDRGTVTAFERACEPVYVVPLGLERYLLKWQIPRERIQVLGWWGSGKPLSSDADLRVTCVPAQHWSQRTAFDKNKTLWGGFVIETARRSVYFAGDTGYFDGFREIGHRFPDIDLALLPIGAYDPEWFMQPQHMNPEQAGQAFLDLGARRMLSIHWGTYKLTDEPLDEPPLRLEDWRQRSGVDQELIVTMPVGQIFEL